MYIRPYWIESIIALIFIQTQRYLSKSRIQRPETLFKGSPPLMNVWLKEQGLISVRDPLTSSVSVRTRVRGLLARPFDGCCGKAGEKSALTRLGYFIV